jgi:hypothetical protein
MTNSAGELLLELKAHVGRAAERVGQLVQDGPGEVREGLELAALDDDPAFCWLTGSSSNTSTKPGNITVRTISSGRNLGGITQKRH